MRCAGCGNESDKSPLHLFRGNHLCSDRCYIAVLESEVKKIRTPDGGIVHETGVSSKTGKGFVTVRWGEYVGQLDCDQAMHMALGILQAANAADSDAALTQLFRERLDLAPEAIQALLVDMRQHRAIRST